MVDQEVARVMLTELGHCVDAVGNGVDHLAEPVRLPELAAVLERARPRVVSGADPAARRAGGASR